MERVCPICGSEEIIEDRVNGEIVCGVCGHVLGRVPSQGPEWRAYGYGDRIKRERVGAPLTPLLHDLGFSTKAPRSLAEKSSEDRKMIRILSQIHGLASSMGLPNVVAETAALIYRKVEKLGLLTKNMYKVIPAASLYLAARIHGIPRMVKEFSIISGVSERSILRCCMKLRLGLKLNPPRIQDAYISRFIKSMNLDGRVEELANTILDMAKRLNLTQGRSSRPLAAAAIYIAAKTLNVRVAQRRLAKVAGISPVTLRKRYKEILREMGEIDGVLR